MLNANIETSMTDVIFIQGNILTGDKRLCRSGRTSQGLKTDAFAFMIDLILLRPLKF